jgi:cyclohexyl-isocyanide hydratase
MGLTLVAEIAGVEAAQSRQLCMEYAPAPPFNAGSPDSAPRAVVQKLLDRAGEILTGPPD